MTMYRWPHSLPSNIPGAVKSVVFICKENTSIYFVLLLFFKLKAVENCVLNLAPENYSPYSFPFHSLFTDCQHFFVHEKLKHISHFLYMKVETFHELFFAWLFYLYVLYRFQHKRLQIQVNSITPPPPLSAANFPTPPPLSAANFPSPTPPPQISGGFNHASNSSSTAVDSLAQSYLSAEDRALLLHSAGGRGDGQAATSYDFTRTENQQVRRESNVTLSTLLSRPSVSGGPPLGRLLPLDLAAAAAATERPPPPGWNSNRPGSGTSTVSEMSSLSSLSVGRSEPANSSGVEETFSLDETADHHPPPPLEEQEESLHHMNYGIAIGKKFSYQCCHTANEKSHLCSPFLGIARPQFHFLHSCVCERFIYSQDRSTYFLQQNRQTDPRNI
jgi:hypothetical protein